MRITFKASQLEEFDHDDSNAILVEKTNCNNVSYAVYQEDEFFFLVGGNCIIARQVQRNEIHAYDSEIYHALLDLKNGGKQDNLFVVLYFTRVLGENAVTLGKFQKDNSFKYFSQNADIKCLERDENLCQFPRSDRIPITIDVELYYKQKPQQTPEEMTNSFVQIFSDSFELFAQIAFENCKNISKWTAVETCHREDKKKGKFKFSVHLIHTGF